MLWRASGVFTFQISRSFWFKIARELRLVPCAPWALHRDPQTGRHGLDFVAEPDSRESVQLSEQRSQRCRYIADNCSTRCVRFTDTCSSCSARGSATMVRAVLQGESALPLSVFAIAYVRRSGHGMHFGALVECWPSRVL